VWKSKTETSHGTIKTRRTHFKEKKEKENRDGKYSHGKMNTRRRQFKNVS